MESRSKCLREGELMKRLLLLVPLLLVSHCFTSQPAGAGDLGIADMKEVEAQQNKPPIFQGRCGGPLSDTIKKCRVSFINGKLVVSERLKESDFPANDFNAFRGITPDQVKDISWNEPQFHKHQRFTNEIIYVSSDGNWTRAGFQFAHGDQVKGFYSELLRWMNQTSQP